MAYEPRPKSEISLRGFAWRPPLRSFLRLALFTGAATLVLGLSDSVREFEFRERGLPADFPRYVGQLKLLKVPAEVASLAWIPTTLRELDASGTEVEVVLFVPEGIERLDLHGAKNLRQLPALPASIRGLDIRFTMLEGSWRFPDKLESLALGGERVETLEGLRDLQLLELTLDDVPNLMSTAGLPSSLQALSISGANFSQLVELPMRLKELQLANTQIRTLNGLPESLQSMTLIGNQVIEVEFPRNLLSLTINVRRQQMLNLDNLVFLNHLDMREWVPLRAFPDFLRDLHIPSLGQYMVVPKALRWLAIDSGAPLLPQLPPGLEELTWGGGSDLTKLPPGLKHLAIPSSPLEDLRGLSPEVRLESLDVSLTGIGIDKLPEGLLSLRYQFCGSSSVSGLPSGLRRLDLKGSVDVRELKALPPRLERLDVSETSIRNLPMLPDTLVELDISNTLINDLRGLKHLRRLRRLTVHASQLKTLAGLPGSVSELRFVEKR